MPNEFQPFLVSKNLNGASHLSPGKPWEFAPDKPSFDRVRAMPKPIRREWMLKPEANWNCYSTFCGLNPNLRVSDTNPAQFMVGISIDYDAKTTLEEAIGLINTAIKDDKIAPNFLEHSLSGNNRLHWILPFRALTAGNQHAAALIHAFAKPLKLASLLPGFDEASYKPSMVWTNGGEWFQLKEEPLDSTFVWGHMVEVGRKTEITGRLEIPLPVLAEEIQKRWPGRWVGDFTLDATGVRFWDSHADCPNGCQLKPDGMLCFTGTVPFMTWGDILGHQWVSERRAQTLGQSGEGVHFDGKDYWRLIGGVYRQMARNDVNLHLTSKGLSDRVPKGRTISDCGEVLAHIQTQNRVDGAAPFVNFPPGLITLGGRRFLNTTNLVHIAFSETIPSSFKEASPGIWSVLDDFFAGPPELMAKETFLAWLQRATYSFRNHTPLMGQAIFICGPVHNGKTLIASRLMTPLLGCRSSNPWDWVSGLTPFNSENFECFLLAINDEESPRTDAQRRAIEARLKSLTVNTHHQIHEKYRIRVQIEWTGRIVVTLNDDPSSIRMLPEVHNSTRDKMMFFRSQPHKGIWAPNRVIEAQWNEEIPRFGRRLEVWEPPKEILENSRYGIKSYYDPLLLSVGQEQAQSYNLLEIVQTWAMSEATWDGDEWDGSPTKLHGDLCSLSITNGVMRDWSQRKVSDALSSLAKVAGSGVRYHVDGDSRHFVISKAEILK